VLGTAESGRERIITRMKLLYQNSYTTDELMMYRYTIHRTIIDCAKALIKAMREAEIWLESDVNGSYCNFLLDYVLVPDPNASLEDTVGQAIDALWKDPSTAKALQSGIEFHMMDSAS